MGRSRGVATLNEENKVETDPGDGDIESYVTKGACSVSGCASWHLSEGETLCLDQM